MENPPNSKALLLLLAASLALCGCTRHFFHKRADKEVSDILKEKDRYSNWQIEQYHVDPDARARFADDGHPDRPPMPPDDPAAHDLCPNPQKPPKRQGIRLMEGEGYLELLKEWDAVNRATRKDARPEAEQKPAGEPASSRGNPLASKTPPRAFLLKLQQAIELGLINSREFQDRREDLYLSALPVTVERFAFTPQLFATEELVRERLGNVFPGGPANRWVRNSTLGFSKLFCTGALLLTQFANRTVVELANTRSPRVLSESTIDLGIVQPLLRGGGKAVTLEPLTLVERNLLYEIRDFARFRKQFFVSLAAGADIGSTAVGTTRFRNRPSTFIDSTGFITGADLRVNRANLIGIPASGFAQASGYLPVVLNQSLLENERENVSRLDYFLQLFEAYQKADQVAPLQVGRVEQQLLQGRSSAFQRDQTLRETLDRFKLQLGVPVDLPLELDDQPVIGQREQLRRFRQIIDEYEEVRETASRLDALDDPAQFRLALQKLASTSKLVQGTQYREKLLRRWNEHQQIPRIGTLLGELTRLEAQHKVARKKRSELELEQKKVDPALHARIDELTFEVELLRLELSLREYLEVLEAERLVPARVASAWGLQFGRSKLAILPDLVNVGRTFRIERLNRFNELFDQFQRSVLVEARNERIASVREKWEGLPRICLEGVDLLTADLDQAEALVARVSLAQRFDLMNTRAQLVDAWRQIGVSANSLLGAFNIEYHLHSLTPPGLDRPFAFDGSRSRHQFTFNGELPLVRILERNNYRASLIGWQRQRRTLMATEDTIVASVRAELRQLRVLAENYRISQRAVELAYLQVENSLDVFQTPPLPSGPTADPTALTQQLLEAQRNLITAQNQLVTFWVQYLTTRMQLYRDLELMPLDPRGAWTDDVATCHCPPDQSPGRTEDAPSPRPVEPKSAPYPGR